MRAAYKRLYYYTAKQWGMKVLWEERLKIAQYREVNDPFELVPFDRTKKKSREFWDKQVDRLLSSRFGILCFSEDWRTTLMWSHYGEKHTGMCLGFDVRSDCVEPITYIDHLRKDPIDHKKELQGVSEQVFEDALRCKYVGWSYEREWRYRVPLPVPIDSVFYKELGDDIYLREVIIGPRCSMSTGDVEDAVRHHPLDVEIFKVRAAFGKFEVCRQQHVPPRTVEGFQARLARLPDARPVALFDPDEELLDPEDGLFDPDEPSDT